MEVGKNPHEILLMLREGPKFNADMQDWLGLRGDQVKLALRHLAEAGYIYNARPGKGHPGWYFITEAGTRACVRADRETKLAA